MSNGYSPAQWHLILRNAHTALAADPTNSRARAALKAAVNAITAENTVIASQEAEGAAQPEPSTLGSAMTGFGEGASLGLASKLGDLLPGPSNTAYLGAARREHPLATFGGDLAGGAALATVLGAAPVLRGLTPAAQGLIGGGLMGAGRGAVEAPSGARGLGAATGGVLGAATGYVGGKIVGRIAPSLGKIAKNLRGGPAATSVPTVAAAGTPEEIAVAAKLGLPIEAVRGRVGQAAITAQARPGLLTPSAPPPIDPLETAPALRGSQLSQLGRGETLPYYPRGGQAEQALAPPPIQSPPVIGPASPEVVARNASHAQLMQALGNPQTSMRIRQVVLAELQRRGIVGPGLLTPLLQ